jgi:hypothetical protein
MSFSIYFRGEPDQYLGDDPSVPFAMGRIVAGELDERFASTLYEWSKRDYEAQWLRSLQRLVNGDTKVALITQYLNPAESSNLEWWALYRDEDDVVYSNSLRQELTRLGDGELFAKLIAEAQLILHVTVASRRLHSFTLCWGLTRRSP